MRSERHRGGDYWCKTFSKTLTLNDEMGSRWGVWSRGGTWSDLRLSRTTLAARKDCFKSGGCGRR